MRDLRRAIALLTIVPADFAPDDPAPVGRAMAWYPLVGLGLGLCLGAAWWALGAASEVLRAALVVTLWAVLTGGLHLDGWSDCCDALLATTTRERRLEILRDPRLGAFGATGLGLLLLVKTAAVASLSGPSALLLAPALARWVLVLVARRWPSARPGGMGDTFRAGLGAREIALASATVWVAVALLGGLPALGVVFVAAGALGSFAASRLGGVTGDVYGAVVESGEAAALVVAALMGHL
ncbi:MAG: adenosylcobinamide-GDP ribazoletransferase [Armatimonadetes bacterium]|nr:adenosylcobinamide-GDP ribazoletransferase [Armatimonadota bacterium]